MSYLSKGEQASLRKRLQSAYNRPEYKEALAALDQLHDELEERNQSAAGSLEERNRGDAHIASSRRVRRAGAVRFKTTNCLESVNALVEERCAKVDHWKNSSQRQRWLATALVDIEPRLRRVIGYRHLPKLREALKRELKIETEDINGVEEEGRLIYEPWRVSTKNGLDSILERPLRYVQSHYVRLNSPPVPLQNSHPLGPSRLSPSLEPSSFTLPPRPL